METQGEGLITKVIRDRDMEGEDLKTLDPVNVSTEDPGSESHNTGSRDVDDVDKDSSDDEDEEEEGMKAAYSVSDLMNELDSGSDNDIGNGDTDNTQDMITGPSNDDKTDVRTMDTDTTKETKESVSQDNDKVIGLSGDLTVSDAVGGSEIVAGPDTLDRVIPASLSPDREISTGPGTKVSSHGYVNEPQTDGSLPHDYEAIAGNSQGNTINKSSTLRPEDIYENVGCVSSYTDDDGWGSSEFESFEEVETEVFNEGERSSQGSEGSGGGLQNKEGPALPQRNKKTHKSRSSISTEMPSPSAVLHRVAARLGSRSKREDLEEDEEEDSPVMEIILNMDKHPPPQLSDMPQDLSTLQVERRHIVASIVDSENSYLASLQRIVEDYEKPLLEVKPHILSRSTIRAIFHKVKDILQCHNMFQIELAEAIKLWDSEEKIGNVFNASFSKSIVFDVYSAFVNNFSVAMETAKKQARTKQMFAEFLKLKLEGAADKLSLFGLMVKPVQRFPQFILLLQDLLKQTPQDHHDRLALQMALTELENLTLKLNETKRESESRHDVKRILGQLMGRFSLKSDDTRHLIRQDDMVQSLTMNGETKSKTRRLFLLNTHLICSSLHKKQTESGSVGRYRYKWCVPIQDVEVIQTASKVMCSTLANFEPPDPPPADHPHKKDLDDLLHDLPRMQQIQQLVNSLRFKYPMMRVDSVGGMVRNLQLLIQQKTDIDQTVLRLSLPTRYLRTSTDKIRDEVNKHIKHPGKLTTERNRSSSLRTVYSFQVHSPGHKQDWLLELKLAKLALDLANNPGWYLPEDNSSFTYRLPLYATNITLDASTLETRLLRRSKKRSKVWIQCAVPVLLPCTDQPGVGIQHLWVCSGEKSRGQITVVSLHTSQPSVAETFKSPGTVCVCAERVPGVSNELDMFDDTVWISTEDNKLHIYSVLEDVRQGPKLTVDTVDMVVSLCYHDNHVYVGHHKGHLAVYIRVNDGKWRYEAPTMLELGSEPVASLMVVSNHVWAVCGQHLHVIHRINKNTPDGAFEKISHRLAQHEEGSIECMVKAGVGLIVSFRNKGTIRLYHFETLEHLQDINTASVVKNFFDGKSQTTEIKETLKRLSVTSLLASKGLLWVGTNIGCILSLPLPRLEGVPQIRSRPSVSYHAHNGPVKFILDIHCGMTPLRPPPGTPTTPSDGGLEAEDGLEIPNVNGFLDAPSRGLAKSADYSAIMEHGMLADDMTLGGALRNRWISTPDLYLGSSEDRIESLHALYGSLLRGLDDDFDVEIDTPKLKRRSKNVLSNLNAVSNRMSKLSGAMMNRLMSQDHSHGNRAATLPVLHEDNNSSHGNSSSDNVSTSSHKRDSWVRSDDITDADQDLVNNDYENFEFIKQQQQQQAPEVSSNSANPPYENAQMCRKQKVDRSISTETTDSQPEVETRSPVMHASHVHNKAVVMVSGGEGHINWNSPKDQDVKGDDTCLLLWQCPP